MSPAKLEKKVLFNHQYNFMNKSRKKMALWNREMLDSANLLCSKNKEFHQLDAKMPLSKEVANGANLKRKLSGDKCFVLQQESLSKKIPRSFKTEIRNSRGSRRSSQPGEIDTDIKQAQNSYGFNTNHMTNLHSGHTTKRSGYSSTSRNRVININTRSIMRGSATSNISQKYNGPVSLIK